MEKPEIPVRQATTADAPSIARAGATDLNLNTGETDTAARALCESMGFTNREGGPEGPPMLFYEREL